MPKIKMTSSTRVFVLLYVVLSVALNCAHSWCLGIYERGVNQDEERLIVDKHNEVRLLIAQGKVPGQPRGVNLKRMKWDQYLADRAQEIADSCEFKHKVVDDQRFYVGQNLYIHFSTGHLAGSHWNTAIDSWFDEHNEYSYPKFELHTGHYTQLVWADTEYVGCGYTYYKGFGYFTYHKLYVCNYGPGGNYETEPYLTGESGCENLC